MTCIKLKSESITWDLTPDEVKKFEENAKEYGIRHTGIDPNQRPIRTLVIIPADRSVYDGFAYSVRPHHQANA